MQPQPTDAVLGGTGAVLPPIEIETSRTVKIRIVAHKDDIETVRAELIDSMGRKGFRYSSHTPTKMINWSEVAQCNVYLHPPQPGQMRLPV